MEPAGNETYVSLPGATVNGIETPPSQTQPVLEEAPVLSRWMLSLIMPADALSNQLK